MNWIWQLFCNFKQFCLFSDKSGSIKRSNLWLMLLFVHLGNRVDRDKRKLRQSANLCQSRHFWQSSRRVGAVSDWPAASSPTNEVKIQNSKYKFTKSQIQIPKVTNTLHNWLTRCLFSNQRQKKVIGVHYLSYGYFAISDICSISGIFIFEPSLAPHSPMLLV